MGGLVQAQGAKKVLTVMMMVMFQRRPMSQQDHDQPKVTTARSSQLSALAWLTA